MGTDLASPASTAVHTDGLIVGVISTVTRSELIPIAVWARCTDAAGAADTHEQTLKLRSSFHLRRYAQENHMNAIVSVTRAIGASDATEIFSSPTSKHEYFVEHTHA